MISIIKRRQKIKYARNIAKIAKRIFPKLDYESNL